jgi:hypothetical protein
MKILTKYGIIYTEKSEKNYMHNKYVVYRIWLYFMKMK